MSIPGLVSVLRDMVLHAADANSIEEVLVAIETKHKDEIGTLQEKVEVERLMRLHAEQELNKKEQQFDQKGKRALEIHDRNADAKLKKMNGASEQVAPPSKKAKTGKAVKTKKRTDTMVKLKHILVEIVEELQRFTDFQRTRMKASVKEFKKADKRLKMSQERWRLLQSQLDVSSSESE